MQNFCLLILAALSVCLLLLCLSLYHLRLNRRRLNVFVHENAALKSALDDHQVALVCTTLQIKEKEQDRIYSNFHDQLNPMLRLVLRRLEMRNIKLAKLLFHTDNLNEEIDIILEILKSVKSCIYDEGVEFLLHAGFIKTLERALQKLDSQSVKISFSNLLLINLDSKFSRSAQLHILRMAFEILNNLLKHASCKLITINLLNSAYNFTIEITHDGKGVSNRQIEKFSEESLGNGLRSCKARCLILNAEINYIFSPLSPKVIITIPFMA